jgi:hypothetical protein
MVKAGTVQVAVPAVVRVAMAPDLMAPVARATAGTKLAIVVMRAEMTPQPILVEMLR